MTSMHRCGNCGENPCPIKTEIHGGVIYSTSMAYCDNCMKLLKTTDNGDGTITLHFGPDPEFRKTQERKDTV